MGTPTDFAQTRRLSVTMVVRDEQDVLAATIHSVRTVADEVVVLDTGSTDRTVAVARKLGARVVEEPWEDDFSAARNRCLAEATGDWVLWLDAGERLEEESAAGLGEFVRQQADPNKVYMVMVEVPPAVPGASSEQAAQLRLMPRRAGLRFEGRLRETLRPSIEACGLGVDAVPGRILRHRRVHDPLRKACKAQRDVRLVSLENRGKVRPEARLLLALGEALCELGDRPNARRTFQQAICASPQGSTEMLEAHYGLLTTMDGDPSQAQNQLAACVKALEAFPLDAQLLCALGNYLQVQNQVDLARRAFDTAVKYGQVDLQTWHLSEIGEIAMVCLSLTLQLQNKDDEAGDVLERGLQRYPQSLRIRRHVIDLDIKRGRLDDALRTADALPQTVLSGGREAFRDAIRGACRAARKDWAPALGHLQSAYAAGCRDVLCLRWLSVTLLVNGRTEDVEPLLCQWQQAEPNNAEVRAYREALTRRAEPRQSPASEKPKEPAPGASEGLPTGPAERPASEEADVQGTGGPRRLRVDPGSAAPGTALPPPLAAQPPLNGPSVKPMAP